jgi:hypothetical protein
MKELAIMFCSRLDLVLASKIVIFYQSYANEKLDYFIVVVHLLPHTPGSWKQE